MDNDSLPKVIEVSAFSGYKVNERPEYFIMDDSRLEVRKIMETWIEPDKDCFKILADDGNVYVLSWDRYSDIWYLEGILQGPL